MDDFFDKDYEVPKSESKYMKFEQGDNRFRIMSSAIVGWEGWNLENKPVRFRMDKKPVDLVQFKEGRINHFWAFVCWDYKTSSIKLLEITQKGVQNAIKSYIDDVDYGDPKKYDFVVNRKGEKLETEYMVKVKPASETPSEATRELDSMTIDLNALYTGGDPFEVKK